MRKVSFFSQTGIVVYLLVMLALIANTGQAQNTVLNNNKLLLRAATDTNSGLQYRTFFGGHTLDGAVLWGNQNGVLGTLNGGQKAALYWGNGKVGIGTASPDSALSIFNGGLHANRGVRFSGLPTSIASNDMMVVMDANGQLRKTNRIVPSIGSGTNAGITWPLNPGGGVNDSAWIRYFSQSGGDDSKLQIGIGNDGQDMLSFYQSGDERMIIRGGKVGVGTDVGIPDSLFTISGGGLHAKRGVRFSGLSTSNASNDMVTVVDPLGVLKKRSITSVGNDNLGDGTATTRIQPTVGNSLTHGIAWPTDPGGGNADAAWMRYFVESGETTKLEIGISNDGDDVISFHQAGEERMVIKDGNVGIGTVSPQAKLDITGNIRIADGTHGQGKVLMSDDHGYASWQYVSGASHITGGGSDNYLAKFVGGETIGNSEIYIDGARVGMGTTTPDSMLTIAGGGLHVNRGVRFTGLATSSAGSDHIVMMDAAGTLKKRTIASIADNLGNGNATTRIQPVVGKIANAGILWPANPGGGSGDSSWIRYFVETGENTKLQIANIGDADDDISFYQQGAERMNIANGNVGIGTTNPNAKLHVVGKIKMVDGTQGAGKLLVSDANGEAKWENIDTLAAAVAVIVTAAAVTASVTASLAAVEEQVGIATDKAGEAATSAAEAKQARDSAVAASTRSAGGDLSGNYPNPSVIKLHGHSVSNTTPVTDQILTWKAGAWQPEYNNSGWATTVTSGITNLHTRVTSRVGIGTSAPGGLLHVQGSISGYDGAFVVGQNGSVGIGTDPSGSGATGYKLAVNGNVKAKKIVVESGWADFVFDEKYRLTPLTEVADFVQKNKHLPGIPKAAEIEKNGQDVAAMQVLMMQKIEELTLYMIQANQQTTQLQKENEQLKTQLQALQQKLNK